MKVRFVLPIDCDDGQIVASQDWDIPAAMPTGSTLILPDGVFTVAKTSPTPDGNSVEIQLEPATCHLLAELCAQVWADNGWIIDEIFKKPKEPNT